MTMNIPKSQADALGFDLSKAVKDFKAARAAHARTVNKPAPTAHPLVEQIVREDVGFTIIDDTPVLSSVEMKAALLQAVQRDMIQRLNAIVSPARQQLARMDLTALGGKLDRSPSEESRVQEIQALFDRLGIIQRHALLLQVEIEDLPDAQVADWQSHGWPA